MNSVSDILQALKKTTLKLDLESEHIRILGTGEEQFVSRIKTTGDHTVEIQAAPDLFVPIQVTVLAG